MVGITEQMACFQEAWSMVLPIELVWVQGPSLFNEKEKFK